MFYKINNRNDIVGIVIYGDKIIAKKVSSEKMQQGIIVLHIENETEIETLPLKSIISSPTEIDKNNEKEGVLLEESVIKEEKTDAAEHE